MLKNAIIGVLGYYELQIDNGYVIGGVAGLDWPWIISAVCLVVFIYCLFRLLGVIFK